MERKRITCPETAHLEQVELEPTPLGLVVIGCSRFEPRCAVACSGACARRMDERERHDSESDERVLIVYANTAYTRPVAEALSRELARDRLVVEQADVDAGAVPPPDDYDAVVIGSPVRHGRHPRALIDFIRQHRDALAAMPSFLFTVGRTSNARVDRMRRETGWLPTHTIGIIRPRRLVRWFGDPNAQREPDVHDLARAVADEIPAREAM